VNNLISAFGVLATAAGSWIAWLTYKWLTRSGSTATDPDNAKTSQSSEPPPESAKIEVLPFGISNLEGEKFSDAYFLSDEYITQFAVEVSVKQNRNDNTKLKVKAGV
jgi:hypothetical protein